MSYANHSTAQLIENENNSRAIYRIQISNLQTEHILTSQSYSCVVKRNNTAVVIITFKSILNEKVSYHFCQVILIFWLQQKVVPYTKYKIKNYEFFIRTSDDPRKEGKRPPRRVATSRFKTTGLRGRIAKIFNQVFVRGVGDAAWRARTVQ